MYHWPIATVLMIAVCIGEFRAQVTYPPKSQTQYLLIFGNGLHPLQWITSNFMHAGIIHLRRKHILSLGVRLGSRRQAGFFQDFGYRALNRRRSIRHPANNYARIAPLWQFFRPEGFTGCVWNNLRANGNVPDLVPENKMQCVFVFFISPL